MYYERYLKDGSIVDQKQNYLKVQYQYQKPYITHQYYEIEEDSDNKMLDEDSQNQIQTEILFKPNKQIQIININKQLLRQDDSMNLSIELYITNDGILRSFSNSNYISFGFQLYSSDQVEQIKKLGIVNIKHERPSQLQFHSVEQSLKYLNSFPNKSIQNVQFLLNKYSSHLQRVKSFISNDIDDDLRYQKEEETQQFSEGCFKFFDVYNKNNPNQMYAYSIGRFNLFIKDFQRIYTGFSQQYLNLLGISEESLSQIILRKQKIDLMKNLNDITSQTLYGLEQMSCTGTQEHYISDIVTFDGFPLKLYQKQKHYKNLFQSNSSSSFPNEYMLTIIEMDVDLEDLENLISYRQRISQNLNLSLDDFLRKELSYKFEDVEYSVHSQQFIEKFYNKNLEDLNELQKQKEDISKQCKYRIISN